MNVGLKLYVPGKLPGNPGGQPNGVHPAPDRPGTSASHAVIPNAADTIVPTANFTCRVISTESFRANRNGNRWNVDVAMAFGVCRGMFTNWFRSKHASTGHSRMNAYFSPGESCLRQIISQFQACRKTADVCVFTITDDRITRALLDAHRRGVKIRIITDNDKAFDLGSDVEQIVKAGISLKMDRTSFHMHHKFAIFDGTTLINGSYNWTRSACEQNMENITVTELPALTQAFQNEFNKLWAQL